MSKELSSPRIRRSQYELLQAIDEELKAKASNLTHDQAQARLSALMSDIWNEADARLRSLIKRG